MMLNFDALTEKVIEAAAIAISQGAVVVSERAKQLAPIRKIFAGGRRKMRFLTPHEFEETKAIRSALGLQTFGSPGPPRALKVATPGIVSQFSASSKRRTYATVVTRGDSMNMNAGKWRGLRPPATAPGRLWSAVAEAHLTRRGKSELKTLRAEYKGQLGGRLRGEIRPTSAVIEGAHVKAMVVSPTPYAKYQEFGTRHNPAHPFLRPAAEESVGEVSKAVREQVQAAVAGGVPGRATIVIRYQMKGGV